MTKITPPPRRPLFAPAVKDAADRAEKPAKAKVDRKAVKEAADRAVAGIADKKKAKAERPAADQKDITIAAIKSPGKPPQLEPAGRAVQLNVKMPPSLMKGITKRAKADGVKPVVVVRRAVEAYLS
jgi:hypothetical protein